MANIFVIKVVIAMLLLVLDLTEKDGNSYWELKSSNDSKRELNSCLEQLKCSSCRNAPFNSRYSNMSQCCQRGKTLDKNEHIARDINSTTFSKSETVKHEQFDIMIEANIFKVLRYFMLFFLTCAVIISNVQINFCFHFYNEPHRVARNKDKIEYTEGTKTKVSEINEVGYENKLSIGEQNKKSSLGFIFKFHTFYKEHSYVYPTSLDKYFGDLFHSNESKIDLLKYEWARYETFKSLPESAVIMPSTLAKNGFYYNGNEDEVTCYFCGLMYKNWKPGDDVREVHRNLSRNCRINAEEETNNVSITECKEECYDGKHGSACGGPNDRYVDRNSPIDNENDINDTYNKTKECLKSSLVNATANRLTDLKLHESTGHEHEDRATLLLKKADSQTVIQQPKHPQYAAESERLLSFSKWSSTDVQRPKILCDAGFFYAGFGDCVRCFFCGGGIRNWENGDTPWIEHARWYPGCKCLWQCKGTLFIDMHRQGNDDQQQIAQEPVYTTDETADVEITVSDRDDSPAVRSVLEMGYDRSFVLSIVDQLIQTGKDHFTATDILEIVLENEVTENNETVNIIPDSNAVQRLPTASLEDITSKQDILPCKDNLNEHQQDGSKGASSQSASSAVLDLQSLIIENRKLKDQVTCKICMDKDACVVFLPCGHMVSCEVCSTSIRKCCICRKLIKGTVRVYL